MSASEVLANMKLYRLEVEMLRECLAVMSAKIEVVDLPRHGPRVGIAAKLPLWLSSLFSIAARRAGRGNKMPSFH
ncbi:MAG: hypothetical protein U0V48_11360 [Anaerolineales bacterium]